MKLFGNPLLTFSVLLQFMAFFWSVRLAHRQKDWRFGLLAFAMGFIAIRRLLLILTGTPFFLGRGILSEIPGIMLGGVTLAAIVALDRTLTERDRAVQELSKSHQQLRELATQLNNVREEERERISGEIHDEIGQALTGLKIQTKMFANQIKDSHPHLLPHTDEMMQLVERTMVSMRDIATELRPSILDNLGLIAAIEWQAETFQNRTGIQCTVHVGLDDKGISSKPATAIFRIFQESLTNVLKHSEATEINVWLNRESGKFVMKVHDNGNGLSANALNKPQALGIVNMRERALAFSGTVEFGNASAGGTAVTLTIPPEHH